MRSGSKVSGKELLQSPERHGPTRPDGGPPSWASPKTLVTMGTKPDISWYSHVSPLRKQKAAPVARFLSVFLAPSEVTAPFLNS